MISATMPAANGTGLRVTMQMISMMAIAWDGLVGLIGVGRSLAA